MKTPSIIPVRKAQILKICHDNPEATSGVIAKRLKITPANARNVIADLVAQGLLSRLPAKWAVSQEVEFEAGDDKLLKSKPTPGRGRPDVAPKGRA